MASKSKKNRQATIKRKTKETEIQVKINLDGVGREKINTGIGFFDHMLTHLSKHSGFDIEVFAKGDLEVDFHHTVEDVGICLGQALLESLGSKGGIRRYGDCLLPMEESLVSVALDFSGRPLLIYNAPVVQPKVGEFDSELAEEFFNAFARAALLTLHINLQYGTNQHHILEAVFKGVAKALGEAAEIINPELEIPSTKGTL